MLHTASRGALAPALAVLLLAPAALPSSAPAQSPGGRDVAFRALDATPRADLDLRAEGRATARGRVVLLHRTDGATDWRPLGAATTGADGRFAVRGRVPVAGRVRVRDEAGAAGPATDGLAVRPVAALRFAARPRTGRVGRAVRVRGTVVPARAGAVVRLQERRGSRWATVARARSTAGGRFVLRRTLRAAGTRSVRIVGGAAPGVAAGRRAAWRLAGLRSAHASWYGPGLYGNRLACGGRLSRGTVGVAHKRLPCGTRVTFRHGGRVVRARVIDRGPYIAGREFDLTAALRARLGFGSTGNVLVDR